ncbi:phosphonate C-P lyase system protein PhnH [Streptomyces antimycoticus]
MTAVETEPAPAACASGTAELVTAAKLRPAQAQGGFVAARAEAVGGFPAGADLLLATPDGRVMGLPRSTTVTIVANAATSAETGAVAEEED